MQIATRVTDEEKQKLEKYCKENDISIAKLIRQALKLYFEQIEKK